jgi:hypothetical protein
MSHRLTQFRSGRLLALGLISILMASTVHSTSAGAAEVPDALTDHQALRADAEKFADILGISVDESMQRLEDQRAAASLLDRVAAMSGGRFAGAWIDQNPTWQVQVRLTDGGRLHPIHELAADSGLPIHVAYRPGPGAEALAAKAGSLSAGWARGRRGVDGVGVDVRTGGLLIVANPSAAPSAALRGTLPPVDVPVRFERIATPESPTSRGGVALDTCTAGFSVQNDAGVKGLAYAGHCTSSTRYATTPNGSTSFTLTTRGSEWNANSDMKWASLGSHIPSANFYGSSATTPTTRSGTGTAYVGLGLCHRGKASGYTCGYVNSTAYAPSYSCNGSACNAVFVRVEGSALANLRGDSGGPWFSGGNAYGIHSGGTVGEVSAGGVFTPVSRLPAMRVRLL